MNTQLTPEVIRHNDYAWIRPDAEACYLCGRKEFATPVDGFQVRPCGKCERPVCERCAETDADCDQDGYHTTSWQCEQECLIDVRVPVTVTFDFSIHSVKPNEVEDAIRRLQDAVAGASLESCVATDFEDGDEALASGTRWTPGSADMENVGVRTHARSGGYSPWKPKTAPQPDIATLQQAMSDAAHLDDPRTA